MENKVDVSVMESQIGNELEKLQLQQKNAFKDLEKIMDERKKITQKIQDLSKILPTLKNMQAQAEDLVSTINDISVTSETITSKIRTLDRAKSRVLECQQRVGDLVDLEICSKGVQTAITEANYEQAAALVHRFLSMDRTILEKTAEDMQTVSGTIQYMHTLQDALVQLRSIVEQRFQAAVAAEDPGAIERFFKLFPLLGLHDQGIQELCKFLQIKMRTTAEQNLNAALNIPASDKRYTVLFVSTLTLLFECFATLLDRHQPLIETYYGPGKLLKAVQCLLEECEQQTRRIVMEWTKVRQIQRKTNLMVVDTTKTDQTKINPKDLDGLIGEITLMHGKIELVCRFIRRKVQADAEVGVPDDKERAKILSDLADTIKRSDVTVCKHDLLAHYLHLEQYFLEESLIKAVSLDTIIVDDLIRHSGTAADTTTNMLLPDIQQQHQVSSMVDDSFYIVKKCIRRSIASGSLDGICAVINNCCRVLENSFCDVLRTRVAQGYPSGYLDLTQAYNVLQNSIQQGRLQAGDTDQARLNFLVALNNANVSIEYVDTLRSVTVREVEATLDVLRDNERGKLDSCLSGLNAVQDSLKNIVTTGMQQLRNVAIKPRINTWIDAFSNIDHNMSEDDFNNYEASSSGEGFAHTLIEQLDGLLVSFRCLLTSSNFEQFVSVLADDVVQRLEKVIMKSSFNRLGGLVVDKEIRSLAGYLTNISSFCVRDKFARLTQIGTILNLEEVVEIHDYLGDRSGAFMWRLTPLDVRAVLALRTDFKADDIKRVKF